MTLSKINCGRLPRLFLPQDRIGGDILRKTLWMADDVFGSDGTHVTAFQFPVTVVQIGLGRIVGGREGRSFFPPD